MKMVEIKDGCRTIYKHVPDDWKPEDNHKELTGDLTTGTAHLVGYSDIKQSDWDRIFGKKDKKNRLKY